MLANKIQSSIGNVREWTDKLNLRLTARQEQFEDPDTEEQDKTSKRHQGG